MRANPAEKLVAAMWILTVTGCGGGGSGAMMSPVTGGNAQAVTAEQRSWIGSYHGEESGENVTKTRSFVTETFLIVDRPDGHHALRARLCFTENASVIAGLSSEYEARLGDGKLELLKRAANGQVQVDYVLLRKNDDYVLEDKPASDSPDSRCLTKAGAAGVPMRAPPECWSAPQ